MIRPLARRGTRRVLALLAAGSAALTIAPIGGVGEATAAPAGADVALEAPRNVLPIPLPGSASGIYLSWTRPQPGDGSAYSVYRDLPNGSMPLYAALGDVYSTHVQGQNPGGAGYCFRVKRFRGGDASGMSSMGCGQAAGTSPLAAPGPLTVAPLGTATDRLFVSWTRPQPNDGSSYEVFVKDGGRWVRKAVVGDVYSTHVTGLQPATRYCFNVVRVKNGVRSGWSPEGCGTTPGQQQPPSSKFGTQIGGDDLPQWAVDKMVAVGARSIRVNFKVQCPASDPAGQLITRYGPLVDRARAAGLEVVGLLANEIRCDSTPDRWNVDGTTDGFNPYIDAFGYDARRIMTAFNGRVAAWEIWNEPDDHGTRMHPANMAALLSHVYLQKKAAGIQTPILMGGIHADDQDGLDAGEQYVRDVYAAGRARVNDPAWFDWDTIRATYGQYPLDGVAYHPYLRNAFDPQRIEPIPTTLNRYLTTFTQAVDQSEGGRQLPIYLTEFGFCAGDAAQAESVRQSYPVLAAASRVARVHQFQLQWDCWGLYNDDGTPRPQHVAAYRSFTVG